MLEADVDFEVAKSFIARVKDKALCEAVLRSITPDQQIVKIFYDELSLLLGGDAASLNLAAPHRILIAGLNGSGKTTSAAKLARLLKKHGRSPNLIALDLQRPAAIEPLATLGKQIDVPIFTADPNEKNVQRAATAALEWHEHAGGNINIFDTAGRQDVDVELVDELQQLKETFLVVDAATGQQGVSVATHLNDALEITGIILTKLDGDARGGAALSMCEVAQRPIEFVSTGERLNQFESFVPERLAGRILGMGDVVGLVERAAKTIEAEDAARLEKKLRSASFDFNDFQPSSRCSARWARSRMFLACCPA